MKVLDIYITKLCNLHCEYCYVDLKKKENPGLSAKQLDKKLNLKNYGRIRFLGGEPLLQYKKLQDIITLVLEQNPEMQFSIITNGLLVRNDILQFFREHNASITISLHKSALKKLLSADFLQLLLTYKGIVGFVVLYDFNNVSLATKLFSLLVKSGFFNFSFSPLVSAEWNPKTLRALEKELQKVGEIVKKNTQIHISETRSKFLKNLHSEKFCSKSQINTLGEKKLCTRFHKEDVLKEEKNIAYIQKLLGDFPKLQNKWFYTCPIGWYLDTAGSGEEAQAVKIFHRLNNIFIDFFRDVVETQKIQNFLTRGISEVRFNLTEQCNLRCNYCYVDFSNKVLDIVQAKNIIDFFLHQDGEGKKISFFGGEPLLEYDILKECILYAEEKAQILGKKVSYTIATNGLLLDEKKISFLKKYNMEIHLSLNGSKKNHNNSRDKSYEKLFAKLPLLQGYIKNIVVLYVIFPNTLEDMQKDIEHIVELGFTKISFEIFLGKHFIWNENLYNKLEESFKTLKDSGVLQQLEACRKENRSYLDISTSGEVQQNSLEFFKEKVDFAPKKVLDSILEKVLKS